MLLSIIVPVYNSEEFLFECLKSLTKTLKHKKVEVIIIDDASTDSSSVIIGEFVKANKGVARSITFSKNRGVGFARNKGLNLARGKYVWFVDSDDWIETDIFPQVSIKNDENKDVIILGFITRMESIFRNKKRKRVDSYPQIKEEDSDFLKWFLLSLKGLVPTPWAYLFSRKFLERKKINFLEDTTYEDIDFTTKVFLSTKRIGVINELAYNYRIHLSSVTQSITKKRIDDCFVAHYSIKKILEKRVLYKQYRKEFNARFLAFGIRSCFDYYFKMSRKKKDDELKQFMNFIRKSELLSFENLALLKKTSEKINDELGEEEAFQFWDSFQFLTNIKVHYSRTKIVSQLLNIFIATNLFFRKNLLKRIAIKRCV